LFNQFYHDVPVLKEQDEQVRKFRVHLSKETAKVLQRSMSLLGIELPNRM